MLDQQPQHLSQSLVRAQLAKILASPEFVTANRSARFLEFVVEKTLLGASEDIKEYVIAVEVFGRKESYDSREHSAVRVEAARLRQRLQKYYATGGVDDQLIIDLPKGQYVPQFAPRPVEAPAPPPVSPPVAPKQGRRWGIPVSIGIGVLLIAAAAWFALRPRPQELTFRYRALTETAGQEAAPSFAPSGNQVVYAKHGSTWHIFIQDLKNPNPTDLTPGSPVDNTQPAFSPDGTRVAFRSERDGGGIFVLDVKTQVVNRISDFCFNPAWSPDGQTIACASEPVLRPEQRIGSKSSLWTIDVASHRTLEIYPGDAVQPAWSPTGRRIAFWTAGEGRARDVWTIAPDGSSPKPVFTDPPLDWCPRWSPDGKWLYFLSDRDSTMNLWRVRIDPSTGDALGPVEPQTTPAIDMSVFSFASTTAAMVYENLIIRGRIVRIDIASGETRSLVEMPPARRPIGPDLSSDGKWITFYTVGKDEEIYVVRTDGTDLRRIVGGDFRSRGPRWSPDNKTISFQSTKSGRAEIWIIQADGTGLHQLTTTSGAEPIQPVWSRDARYIAYSRTDGTSAIIDLKGSSVEPQTMPAKAFFARSWSPDGNKILGQVANTDSAAAIMAEYDIKTGKTTELGVGNMGTWDPDGLHVLYESSGDVWRLEVASGRKERIVKIQPNRLAGLRRSPDGKYLYASISSVDSDLWLREPAK